MASIQVNRFLRLPLCSSPIPLNTTRMSGGAVSSHNGVWGGAPAEIEFCAFWHKNLTSGDIKFAIFF